MIEFKDVNFEYTRKQRILRNISFKVETGAFHGLIGNNGVGKSTIIKLLIGALNLESGDILINGYSIRDNKNNKTIISFLPDNTVFPAHLNVVDYIYSEVMLIKDKDKFMKEKIENLLNQFDLLQFAKKSPNKLSKGQQKKVELIRILLEEPELIVLDEPTNYLDPEGRAQLLKFLKKLNQERNTTIFLSSHVLQELKYYIDSVTIISSKGVAYSGPVQGDEVIEIYNQISEHREFDFNEKI